MFRLITECLKNLSYNHAPDLFSERRLWLVPNNDEILHVIYDYTSKEEDELTLKFVKKKKMFWFFFVRILIYFLRRGSIVEVLSKDEKISGSEGWWTGRLLDSDSVGIFPANFVASFETNLRIIDENDLLIGDLIGVGGFG